MISGMLITYALSLALYCISYSHMAASASNKELLNDLHHYEIHKLSDYSHMNNARNGRKLLQSRGERKLSYEFEVFGRVLALELTRDDELFSSDYKHYFVVPKNDGSHDYIIDHEADTRCHYKATVNGNSELRGRISLCGPGMRGLLQHNEIGNVYIQPLDEMGDEHVVYRASDVKNTKGGKCGVDGSSNYETKPMDNNKMKNDQHQMNQPSHDHDHEHDHHAHPEDINGGERRRLGNGAAKLVRLLVVNDYKRYQQYGANVHAHSATLISTMDTLYSTIGGSYTFDMQIVGMMTYSYKDPYTLTMESSGYPKADNLLSAFDSWRESGGSNFPTDYSVGMLFSGYNFDGNTIGLAYVSGACNAASKSNIVQAVDLSDALVASTGAHELGHNLGMQHDDVTQDGSIVTTACYDANNPHIMDASSSGAAATKWSTCSANWVKQYLEGYGTNIKKYDTIPSYPSCMEKCFIGDSNPPSGCTAVATWSSTPVCGDGLRQGDEECDCPNKDCTGIDPCCNGATCTLKSGSKCSALDACCSSCQIVTDTTKVCRESVGECDNEEKCDGTNAACPTDSFKQTGVPCGSTAPNYPGICYYKQCKSHLAQCMVYSGQGSIPVFNDDCPTADNNDGNTSCGKLACKPASSSSCQQFTTVYVEDGTQCDTAKACFAGTCTDYSEIPVPGSTNCTNGVKDDDEVGVDCGGPKCFGCSAGSKCYLDRDCIYPATCNITDSAKASAQASNGTAEGICTGDASASGMCFACPLSSCPDAVKNAIKVFCANLVAICVPIGVVVLACIVGCCFCCRTKPKKIPAEVDPEPAVVAIPHGVSFDRTNMEQTAYYDKDDINSYPAAQRVD